VLVHGFVVPSPDLVFGHRFEIGEYELGILVTADLLLYDCSLHSVGYFIGSPRFAPVLTDEAVVNPFRSERFACLKFFLQY